MNLLKDPYLLVRLHRLLGGMGVAGEGQSSLALFIIALSRFLDWAFSAISKAVSAAGKNFLIERVSTLIPAEDSVYFTRASQHALEYIWPDDLKHKFVVFEQLEAALDRSGFFTAPDKRPTVVQNLRTMFVRMGATEQEIRTLRGIVKALVGAKQKRPDSP